MSKEKRPVYNGMKMPPKGTAHEIPSGVYGPNSRLNGTDINRQVYQVGQTSYSDIQRYRDGYDNIKWEREEDGDNDKS